jgi:hypothetical protein
MIYDRPYSDMTLEELITLLPCGITVSHEIISFFNVEKMYWKVKYGKKEYFGHDLKIMLTDLYENFDLINSTIVLRK